jgi:glucose uptake protein GlcU
MFIVVDALTTVLAWGAWIGVAQAAGPIPLARRTLYVTIGNLLFALVAAGMITSAQPAAPMSLWSWSFPFAGGFLWAVGNLCAFAGVGGLGIARAAAIWTSINVLTALVWGGLLFHEFAPAGDGSVARLAIALVALLSGLLIVVLAGGRGDADVGTSALRSAVLASLAAGVLWGSYFVPAQASGLSPRLANVPLAAGMVAGAVVLAVVRSHPTVRLGRWQAYPVLLGAGALWGVGNLGMLVLVERIGTGKGYAIAQLGLVVNAMVGIFIFHVPRPRSHAAKMTLCGAVLATIGGVLVGQSR